MKTILITGGAGFIGGWLIRQLCDQKDVRVVNYDRLTYAGNLGAVKEFRLNGKMVFVHGDIADRELVRQTLETYRPDAIVNLAAESHVDRSIDAPAEFVQTNVVGTVNLLLESLAYWQELTENEKQTFRFLHVSTDEVYGSLGETGLFRETASYAPNSPYSASKAASDHFVRAFHRTYGLPVLTTHSSNNYGPYQFPEKLIPVMILNAMQGKPLPVYGDGLHVRDWIYVEDHCRAIQAVLNRGKVGEIYHIGGKCELKNIELVQAICKLVSELCPGLPFAPIDLITFVKDRAGHDYRYAMDISKIENELNWSPKKNFEIGIRETVQWYLENS